MSELIRHFLLHSKDLRVEDKQRFYFWVCSAPTMVRFCGKSQTSNFLYQTGKKKVCIWHIKSEFYGFRTLSRRFIKVKCEHSASMCALTCICFVWVFAPNREGCDSGGYILATNLIIFHPNMFWMNILPQFRYYHTLEIMMFLETKKVSDTLKSQIKSFHC